MIKTALATTFDWTGLNAGLLALQRARIRPHIRCINYHDVPQAEAAAFEDQLRFYSKHFAPVGHDDLLALHEGSWERDKPGLLLSFDDGLQSHVDVAAPLLEKYGMTGGCMVPAAVAGGAPGGQRWDHTVV
ncbi:MAG: hypothetical protein ABGY41_05270, partial [Candidatus Poribacteria bacterium]